MSHNHSLLSQGTFTGSCDQAETKSLSIPDIRCPPSFTGQLPLEVIYHSIGFLRGDSKSLWPCLLVCRAWYPFSIMSLYTDITISERRQFVRFTRSLSKAASIHSLLLLTRSLAIVQPESHVDFMHIAPLILGSRLVNVEHLTLQGRCSSACSARFMQYLPRFSSVTELTLRRFTPPNHAAFRRMLCAFPKLLRLQLISVSVKVPTLLQNGAYGTGTVSRTFCHFEDMPKLKDLVITEVDSVTLELVVKWLIASDACEELRILHIDQNILPNARSIVQLLKSVAPSIQCLRLMDHEYGQPFLLVFVVKCMRMKLMVTILITL